MLPTLVRRPRNWEETAPMERFFDRFFRPWLSETGAEAGEYIGSYPVDIREEDGKLVVDAEMPGFDREDVGVSVDKGVLRIRAERKPEESKGTRHLNERRYTRVERAFTLPTPVDESNIDAKLDNGVLHIELPETEESKPRQIEVK